MSTAATRTASSRNRLLTTSAVAAIAALTMHAPARAQSAPPQLAPGGFQGTVGAGSSGATVTPPAATDTNTLVTIQAPRAILNWTPNDNRTDTTEAINFLPGGRSAEFVNSTARSGQDYIVLNRILPTATGRVVALNGIVTSTLSTVASGARGGQVWFYAPGGILVGGSAIINVGSMLLSANNIGDEDFLDGNTSFTFGRDDSNGAIEISTDAQISAFSHNAYVALIAPRVRQSGTITTIGSAAYVAAEDVTMTISGSMFNIEVASGTDVGGTTAGDAALVHDGTTNLTSNEAGYGEAGYGDPIGPRHAVMVAVPKNDAITMLVSGRFDYQAASSARVVDNKIILSGGHNVENGAITQAAPAEDVANIRIFNPVVDGQAQRTRFESDVVAQATGAVSATAVDTSSDDDDGRLPDLFFGGSATLIGAQGATFDAGANTVVRVVGDLTLDASGFGSGAGERASLIARAGSDLEIEGAIDIRADAAGASDFNSTRAAELVADGGAIRVVQGAVVQAEARAELQIGRDAVSATGGAANIANSNSGTIEIGGPTLVSANAVGRNGGAGTGGAASIISTGGLDLGDHVAVTATGIGGRGLASGPGETGPTPATAGGAGRGGTATIELAGANSLGVTTIDAGSRGGAGGNAPTGNPGTGGSGAGGEARFTASSGNNELGGLTVDASRVGGAGGLRIVDEETVAGDSLGGDASGLGNAIVEVTGGTVVISGDLSVSADAFGGVGGSGGNGGDFSEEEGASNESLASVSAIGGSLLVDGSATVSARAEGGQGTLNGRSGGSALGGDAALEAGLDGLIRIGNETSIFAGATGGAGVAQGGEAFGGRAQIKASGGSVRSTNADGGGLILRADATGGDGESGGSGDGGQTSVDVGANDDGGVIASESGLVLSGVGTGGSSTSEGPAGDGFGGQSFVRARDGSIAVGALDIDNQGVVGSGTSGEGKGGLAQIENDAPITISGPATIDVSGTGAGAAGGGIVFVTTSSIDVAGDVTLRADGTTRDEGVGTAGIVHFSLFGTGRVRIGDALDDLPANLLVTALGAPSEPGAATFLLSSDAPDALRVADNTTILVGGDAIFRNFEGADQSIVGLRTGTLNVSASDAIRVFGTSISTYTDLDGNLLGSIGFDAPSILVASEAAIADLAVLDTVQARSDRLGINDGSFNPEGNLRAADITLSGSQRVYVQNSGVNSDNPDDRAGFTVGPSTMTIVTESFDEPVEVIINGRAEDGSGGFVTGAEMLDEVVFTGDDGTPANIAEGSTINGCTLDGECAFAPPPPPPPPPPSEITGFIGTPNVVGGNASVTDDHSFITVSSPRAIINWTDAETDFLPAANFAEFRGGSDYIVLNRVLPTDMSQAIQLNGRIDSFVGRAAGQGKIWFYSPSGILVGSTARINVGSLLLSGGNIEDEDFLGTDSTYSFARADSGAAIEIAPGALMEALSLNAYVALVAPRVRQSGEVRVDGSAAYVAAEAATLSLGAPLLDIAINRGSGVNGTEAADAALVHDGSTTLLNQRDESGYGPTGDPRRALLVAAPQDNNATMLVSGAIQYEAGDGTGFSERRIILSGGYDIADGAIDQASGAEGRVDIRINNGSSDEPSRTVFESDLVARATGGVTARATNTGTFDDGIRIADLVFAGSATLVGVDEARLEASDAIVSVGGDLTLDASGVDSSAGTGSLVARDGSLIRIAGDTSIMADARAVASDGSVALDIINSGLAEIVADGGDIEFDGRTTLSASAQAGDGSERGGNAVGGTVRIEATEGSLDFGYGELELAADGIAGNGFEAGDGAGGRIFVTARTGTIRVAQGLTARADGTGGNGATDGNGGSGRGGTADVSVSGATLDIAADLRISATALGGGGPVTGAATGGTAGLHSLSGGTVDVGGRINVEASVESRAASTSRQSNLTGGTALVEALGGTIKAGDSIIAEAFAINQRTGNALDVTGGTATVRAADGGEIDGGPQIYVDASGYGFSGGRGFGGTTTIEADDGTITSTGSIDAGADGYAGPMAQGAGLVAQGGTASLRAINGGIIGGRDESNPTSVLTANAVTFSGGDAKGGATSFEAIGGTIALSGYLHDAVGSAGDTGTGGQSLVRASDGGSVTIGPIGQFQSNVSASGHDAAAGSVTIEADNGDIAFSGDELLITADASGSDGGTGRGGTVLLRAANGGTITATTPRGSAIYVVAQGYGGNNGDEASGGEGRGGSISIEAAGGSITANQRVDLLAAGFGGAGGPAGGAGQGGSAALSSSGGATLKVGATELDADGHGGSAFASDGAGGSGTGGSASVTASAATILFDAGASIHANGTGGTGDNAGDGTGGTASLVATRIGAVAGTITALAGISLAARGGGGGPPLTSFLAVQPATGGDGTGGTALVSIEGDLTIPTLDVDVSGTGGEGTDDFNEGGTATSGSDGTGGTATVLFKSGTSSISEGLSVDAQGTGGDGGSAQTPGAGGNGTGGTASVTTEAGTVSLGSTAVIASGRGGDGGSDLESGNPGSDGGAGTGGTALFAATGGVVTVNGLTSVDAGASGGGATGPGGAATGGDAAIRSNGASMTFNDDVEVYAAAIGGESSDAGGAATGGSAEVEALGGDLVVLGELRLEAGASGGFGVNQGGDALGGDVKLTVGGGNVEVSNSLLLHARGRGGESLRRNGSGTGGTADLAVTSLNGIGGSLAAFSIGIDVSGESGFFGEEGEPTGEGGDGTGGEATVLIDGAITTEAINILATGRGIRGRNDAEGPGADGGDGVGGSASIEFRSGTSEITSLRLDARGVGGDGGDTTSGTGESGGAGGDGIGGETSLLSTGGEVSIKRFGMTSAWLGGSGGGGNGVSDGGNGDFGGAGGAGIGGTLTLGVSGGGSIALGVIEGGTVTIGGTDFDASGSGGNGGNGGAGGPAGDGGSGGDGVGGSISVESGDGTLTIASRFTFETEGGEATFITGPNFLADGVGGQGGSGGDQQGDNETAGSGGSGGDGTGGTIEFIATGGAALNFGPALLSAVGAGGSGARGGSGFVAGDGGDGGGGVGGTIEVEFAGTSTIAQQSPLFQVTAGAVGGTGGGGGAGIVTPGPSGTGGEAVGGAIDVRFGPTFAPAEFGITGLTLDANATGGDGGSGFEVGYGEPGFGGDAADGGDGGDGFGGDIVLASAVGRTNFGDELSISANGTGGAGGGSTDGIGGDGGEGIGGSAEASADGSARLTAGAFSIQATGEGGVGGFSGNGTGAGAGGDGTGGDAAIGTSGSGRTEAGSEPGDGIRIVSVGKGGDGGLAAESVGDGGDGFGGMASVIIAGGTIVSPNILQVGAAGQGGSSGTDGLGGSGTGGLVEITVGDSSGGSAGTLNAGSVNLLGSGFGMAGAGSSFAGLVRIVETGQAAGGSIEFGQLSATAFGGGDVGQLGFELTTANGPIRVTGDVDISTELDASLTGVGDGRMEVGGRFDIFAGQALFLAQDAGVETPLVNAKSTFVSADSVRGDSAGLAARDDLIVEAINDVTLGRLSAGDDILITASSASIGFAVTDASGTEEAEEDNPGSKLIVETTGAISVADADIANDIRLTSTEGNVTSSGTLAAGGDVLVSAGGNIGLVNASAGSDIALSGNAIALSGSGSAGDSILVEGDSATLGDLTTTNTNVDGASGISVFVGGAASIRSADSATFIDIAAGSFSGGALTAADFARISTSSESGGSGAIDVDSVEAGGSISLLAEGEIFAGALNSETDIVVSSSGTADLGSAAATRDLSVEADNIALASGTAGRDISLDATGDIDVAFAQAGDDLNIVAGGAVDAETLSTTGLGEDITETGYGPGPGDGSNIIVLAAGDVAIKDADAADDITLTSSAAGVTSSGTLDAGRDLTIQAAGSADLATIRAGDDIRINAALVSIGAAETDGFGEDEEEDGSNLIVEATGSIDIADADVAIDIALTAEQGDVSSTGALLAGRDLAALAGNEIALTTARAGGDIALLATGDISSSGTLTADFDLAVNGGTIALADANAGVDIALLADGDISSSGTLTAGVDLDINGESIALNDASAAGDIALLANGNVSSSGTLTAGVDLDVNGGAIALTDASAGGDLALLADGSISSSGLLSTGGNLDANGGSIAFANAAAVGDIALLADGAIVASGLLSAGGDLAVDAGGDIMLSDARADLQISLSGNAVALTGVATAGDSIFVEGASADLGQLTTTNAADGETPSGISVSVGGEATIRSADSAAFIDVAAGSFSGGNLIAADFVRVSASSEAGASGKIDVEGVVAGSFINLSGSGAVAAASLGSATDITVTSGGLANLGTANAGRDLLVDAQSITLENGTAGRDVRLLASGAITVTTAQAGDDFVARSSDGSFTGGSIVTDGLGEDLSESGYGSGDGSNIIVDSAGAIRLDNGAAVDLVSLTANDRIDSAGLITADRLDARAASDIALNDVDVTQSLVLSTSAGSVSGRDFVSDGDILLDASNAITLASADAGGGFRADGATIDIGSATANGDVDIDGIGDVTIGEANAGNDVTIFAGGAAVVGQANALGGGSDGEGDGFNVSVEANGNLTFGSADTIGDLRLVSNAGGIGRLADPGGETPSLIDAGGDIFVSSAVDLTLAGVEAGGSVTLSSDGVLDVDTVMAGSFINLLGDGAVAGESLTSGSDILVSSGGLADLGTANAGRDLAVNAQSIALANGTAGRDIRLLASDAITVTTAQAGDDFVARSSNGTASIGTVVTTGLGEDAIETGYGPIPGDGSNIRVTAAGDARLDNGDAASGIILRSNAASVLSDGLLRADSLSASAAADIALNDVIVAESLVLFATGGLISGGSFTSGGGIDLAASEAITLAAATAQGDIALFANGAITLGNGDAGGSLFAESEEGSIDIATASAGGSLTLSAGTMANLGTGSAALDIFIEGPITQVGSIAAGRDILLDGAEGISLTFAQAGDDFVAESENGAFTAGRVVTTGLGEDAGETGYGAGDGSNILVSALSDVRLDNGDAADAISLSSSAGSVLSETLLTARSLGVTVAGDIAVNDVTTVEDLILSARDGRISGGDFVSGGVIDLSGGSGVSLLSADAGGSVSLTAGAGGVSIGSAQSGDFISLFAQTGPVSAGTLTAASDIALQALDGPVAATSLMAGRDLSVRASGDVTLGSAQAGDDLSVRSGGIAMLQNLVTTGLGDDAGESGPGDGSNISIGAEGNALVGNARSAANLSIVSNSGDIRLETGQANGRIDLTANAGSILSGGALTARQLGALAGADLALTDVSTTADLVLSARNGAISGNSFTSGGAIDLTAADGVSLVNARGASIDIEGGNGGIELGFGEATGSISLLAQSGNIGTGDLTAGGGISIQALNGAAEAGSLVAGRDLSVGASGDVSLLAARAGGEARFAAGRNLDVGTIRAGAIGGSAGGAIDVQDATATGAITLQAGTGLRLARAAAGTDILLSGGALQIGSVEAGDDLIVQARSLSADRLATTGLGEEPTGPRNGSNIRISVDGLAAVATADAAGGLLVQAADIAFGSALATRGDVTLGATGSVTVQQARAGDDISVTAGTTALVGAAAAPGTGVDNESDGANIRIAAVGNISFGTAATPGGLRLVSAQGGILRLGAPQVPASNLIEVGGDVLVDSAFDLNLASVTAGGAITLGSDGAIDAGALKAGNGLVLTAGAGLQADSIETGAEILASGTSIDFGSVKTPSVLDLATAGAIRLGPVDAGDITGVGASIVATTLTSAGGIALSAMSGDVTVQGATARTDIALSGGRLALADGIAGRDILLDARGDIAVGTARAGDDFEAQAGGSFAATNVVTTGLGPDVGDVAGGGITRLAGPDGSNIRINATGSVQLATGTAADVIQLASRQGGIASTQSLTAGDSILADAATGMTLIDATAGQGIDLRAGGAVSGAALTAGTDVRLSSGGTVALASAVAGDDVDVTAAGTATFGSLTTTGRAPDDGNNGASVIVAAAGGVTAATINSAGGVSLRALNGAVLVSQDLRSARPVEASGRAVTLNAIGALAVRSATASAGNVALASGGNLAIDTADASSAVNGSSGGALSIAGAVNGAQLSFSSRDIEIGSSAQVGTAARTQSLQISANGGNVPIVIGGTAQGAGYRLDNAEFARLTARDVRISGQGENATMQIDALTVRGAASGTSFNVGNSLTLASSGDVEMIGRLSFENAGDTNLLRISSGRTFFADNAGAGIAVTGQGAAPGGRLEIDGRSIIVAGRGALADLATATDVRSRDERLGTNDAGVDNGGFLRAGSIRLAAADRIFVQNSGANTPRRPNERAGMSAGAGGITLASLGTTPVEVIINGRQDNGQGGFVLGKDLIPAIRTEGLQGAGFQFAQGSTVNGCLVSGGSCGEVFQESPFVSAREIIERLREEDASEASLTRPSGVGFNRLISLAGSPFFPMVEEPVTGAGNEDLGLDSFGPLDAGDALPGQNEIGGAVTGAGNEALQSESEGQMDCAKDQQSRGQSGAGSATCTKNDPIDRSVAPTGK